MGELALFRLRGEAPSQLSSERDYQVTFHSFTNSPIDLAIYQQGSMKDRKLDMKKCNI